MPETGWKATGLLLPLWNRYKGGREALASAVGTSPSTLSSINTGNRRLGYDLAGRLAAELGVTVTELGAPNGDRSPRDILQGVIEQLERLLAQLPPPARPAKASGRRG